jgi:hypothetical protein
MYMCAYCLGTLVVVLMWFCLYLHLVYFKYFSMFLSSLRTFLLMVW